MILNHVQPIASFLTSGDLILFVNPDGGRPTHTSGLSEEPRAHLLPNISAMISGSKGVVFGSSRSQYVVEAQGRKHHGRKLLTT